MESSAFIQIRDLRKTFIMGKQKVNALAGVDLDIQKGSFTVIMGPSGSGKSTLLYQLGGLDRCTSGSIKVQGLELQKMDENDLGVYRRKMVGFIFQSFNLISSMTALQNVIFPMRFAGIAGGERHKRAVRLLQQVGLANRALHRPTELSGGQQQRVAVARSLVNNPPMILADEPTGNLDTSSGLSIMKLLSQLHLEGRTVVVVSHDLRMRQFASDTIYLLDGLVVSEAEYEAASHFEIPEEEPEENKI
ncbi:MAG: macrolide ABC transporter ATP-binding protein [Chloroflexi bacterium HGW-Chloroflexi-10]|nr:MAG: macrolide ABC transporter ATP-binding protein [Chloroflexi bacterium HGW-Chloroflexi-10]